MIKKSTATASGDQWSSRWGFILAATGAAVGLGNIWRFPYMAGENGGSAFVILYLLFVAVIGVPIMIAEFSIGRSARKNPVTSLKNLAQANGHSKHWGLLGWWGALALLLTLSFYSVVSGWSIAYLYKTLIGQFQNTNPQAINQNWQQFLSNPWQLLGWHTLFMLLTLTVIAMGVKKGLERATKIMMPGLYLILIVLVCYAAIRGDFSAAVRFLFQFDYHKITPSVVIAAMGHAFFTLALGAGALLTYGAYIPKKINLIRSTFIIATLDALVALFAGLAIFPIVFANHLPPSSGPGLMFISLPDSFSHMPYGSLIGGLFFLLLLFAAWTSSINLAEPLVVILREKLKISRIKATFIIGSIAWLLGIGSVLSFNVWQNVRLQHFTLFDLATNIPTDFLLPLGGIGFAIFAGWVMSRQQTESEINTKTGIYTIWRLLIRYIAPLGVLCVFLGVLW